VAEDYYAAMNRVEQHLELVDQPIEITPSILQLQLASLVEQLFTPCLSEENRINIACQMKELINDYEIEKQFKNNHFVAQSPSVL
jgi:hypothetical protein